MTRDPAGDLIFPAQRPGPEAGSVLSREVGPEEYCQLLLARRSIDRLQHGVPRGYRGLRDARTGQTWLVREDALLPAS
jgi:hypothetical protein